MLSLAGAPEGLRSNTPWMPPSHCEPDRQSNCRPRRESDKALSFEEEPSWVLLRRNLRSPPPNWSTTPSVPKPLTFQMDSERICGGAEAGVVASAWAIADVAIGALTSSASTEGPVKRGT